MDKADISGWFFRTTVSGATGPLGNAELRNDHIQGQAVIPGPVKHETAQFLEATSLTYPRDG